MIAVIQRVTEAQVHVGSEIVGAIGRGLVALVAVCASDTSIDVQWMARKLVSLRIFREADKHFQLDVKEAGGSVLLISNFTVAGSTRQGRRPSFELAADAAQAGQVFTEFVDAVRATGITVATGRFGADMSVNLVNDGPVTLILDSGAGR